MELYFQTRRSECSKGKRKSNISFKRSNKSQTYFHSSMTFKSMKRLFDFSISYLFAYRDHAFLWKGTFLSIPSFDYCTYLFSIFLFYTICTFLSINLLLYILFGLHFKILHMDTAKIVDVSDMGLMVFEPLSVGYMFSKHSEDFDINEKTNLQIILDKINPLFLLSAFQLLSSVLFVSCFRLIDFHDSQLEEILRTLSVYSTL